MLYNLSSSYFFIVPMVATFVSSSTCWSFQQETSRLKTDSPRRVATVPPSVLTKLHMSATESALSSLSPVIDSNDAGNSIELLSAGELKLKLQNKRVALYFSAGWCPMCTSFESSLLQFRKDSEDSDRPIELIYISSDRTETDAQERAFKLGMLSVPFDRAAEYKKRFNIWSGQEVVQFGNGRRSGVPALVVLGSKDGSELKFIPAESQGEKALKLWPLDDEENGIW